MINDCVFVSMKSYLKITYSLRHARIRESLHIHTRVVAEILFKVASMNEDNAKLSGEDPRFAKVYASSVKTSIENIREILNKKSTLYPVG